MDRNDKLIKTKVCRSEIQLATSLKRSISFSLIELLVVIAIISILMTILLPALYQVKESTKRIACINNLKQIGFAYQNYVNDHDGWAPMIHEEDGGNYYTCSLWYGKLRIYTTANIVNDKIFREKNTVFRCPSKSIPGTDITYANVPYGMSSLMVGPYEGIASSIHGAIKPAMYTREPTIQIVAGDSGDSIAPFYITRNWTYRPGFRHQKNANFLFLDAHTGSLLKDCLWEIKRWNKPADWEAYKAYDYRSEPSGWENFLSD